MIDGILHGNPEGWQTSGGGGGDMQEPVKRFSSISRKFLKISTTPGMTNPTSLPPASRGQNQQCMDGIIGQLCESCLTCVTPEVPFGIASSQSIIR